MAPGFRRLQALALTTVLAAGLVSGPGALCLPALAQDAAVGSFPDVPLDHWAFLTVELLVRKYKVMAGFPDGTFGGDREVTRYELAAALTRVVDRMAVLMAQGVPVSPADVASARQAATGLSLPEVEAKLAKLEANLKAIADKPPTTVTVTGHSGATWMDNTQDNLPPYITTGLSVTLKSSLPTGVDLQAGMSGDLAGQTAGNKPATAGSDKPPTGDWKQGSAHLTAHPFGQEVRTGLFEPKDFFGTGSELKGHWGGIVGNGFISPNRNTVRWGDKNVAVAGRAQWGGLKASAAVTPVVLIAGLDWQPNDWLRFKLSGDTDQPDWTNLFGSNKIVAHNVYAVADVGTSHLGMCVQGGLAKDLLQASTELLWCPIGELQIGLGAIYRSSDKGVTEVTPGASLFIPSYWVYQPAFTLGVKEPEVVSTDHGNTGPGSLLGEQAGYTVSANWKLEDLGFPNITVEYNIQQPVLFYKIYDATFALSVGRDF